jgi:hypothetical protein
MSEEVPFVDIPIDFDFEDEEDPFAHVVPGQMDSALKKMGIKKTWEMIKSAFVNENYAFNEDFCKGENPAKVASMFSKVYFFGKIKNPATMVGILTKWLKLNWATFHAPNIEGVIKNIEGEVKKWNKTNPHDQKLFINWIPKYGGKTEEEMVR